MLGSNGIAGWMVAVILVVMGVGVFCYVCPPIDVVLMMVMASQMVFGCFGGRYDCSDCFDHYHHIVVVVVVVVDDDDDCLTGIDLGDVVDLVA